MLSEGFETFAPLFSVNLKKILELSVIYWLLFNQGNRMSVETTPFCRSTVTVVVPAAIMLHQVMAVTNTELIFNFRKMLSRN